MHHDSISRKHAMVLFLDGKFLLNDLGSTNGCCVNGEQLVHKRYELVDGDVVHIGDLEFKFEPANKP